MKKVFKKLTMAIAAIMTIGGMSLVSCDKEVSPDLSQNVSMSMGESKIPQFKTREEILEEIKKATSFDTITDLLEFEKKQGRNSIGATSDAFYESIDPETFKDEMEVLSFYEENIEYLDTVMENGEINIMPKWFNTPYRYVANKEGMFIVGNYCYKIFKKGIVATDINHISGLSVLNEKEIEKLDTTIYIWTKGSEVTIKHNECQSEWKYTNTLTSGKNRVTVELVTNAIFYGAIGKMAETRVHTFSRHKWLGVWWITCHTLTVQGDVTWHRRDVNDNWDFGTQTIYKKNKCTGLWVDVHSEPCVWDDTPKYYHYYAYHLNASTPSLSFATLSHN